MSKDWDYAKLSKSAHDAGSPEEFVKQQREAGAKEAEPEIRKEVHIEDAVTVGILLGVVYLVKRGWEKYKNYKEAKQAESQSKIQDADADAQKFIEEMNAANAQDDCDEEDEES